MESLLELIVDVVGSTAATIRIGGEIMSAETVKHRFRQLDSSHIEYVIDSLKQTTTKINNIRAYLLIRYRNDAERMERLQAATPETYQYFTELEANNWSCLAA